MYVCMCVAQPKKTPFVTSILKDVTERVFVQPGSIATIGTIVRLLCEPFLLIGVDGRFASPEIRVLGPVSLGLVDELVARDHDQVQRDAEVSGDEVLVVKSTI